MSAFTDRAMVQRTLLVISLVAAALLLAFLVIYLFHVLLLVFAGALVAVLLRAPADWIARRSPLTPGWALALVIVVAAALAGLAGWFFGQNVAQQAGQLVQRLPETIETVRQYLAEIGWKPAIDSKELSQARVEFLGRSVKLVSDVVGAVATLGITLLMAVFFAAQPDLYVRGVLHLVPKARRARAHEVLEAIGRALRWWVVGRASLMLLVALLTGVGLWLLGVPFALALGMLAGVLTFIPYLGPVLSFVPAALVAVAESPVLALYVGMLYVGVQTVESVLQPIIQQRAVHLPPVLVVAAQIALGILAGVLGVMLATPLTACLLAAVKMLYVEDVLGDREGARL